MQMKLSYTSVMLGCYLRMRAQAHRLALSIDILISILASNRQLRNEGFADLSVEQKLFEKRSFFAMYEYMFQSPDSGVSWKLPANALYVPGPPNPGSSNFSLEISGTPNFPCQIRWSFKCSKSLGFQTAKKYFFAVPY